MECRVAARGANTGSGLHENQARGNVMATAKQKAAARKNVKKAAKAAKRKRTVANLPRETRTALGREGAKAARKKKAAKKKRA
jgi:hypothetical protein